MKKYLILFFSMTIYCQVIWCKDNFAKGLLAAQQNNYIAADSLFTEYLKKFPTDANAKFNLANVKLQLRDTCRFCNDMMLLSLGYGDKEAWKLFSNTCGKIDSLYYNDKFELTSDKKPRFIVVSIPHFCEKSYGVTIYDNKRKNIPTNILSLDKKDAIANYKLQNDGSKTYFLLADSKPMFPGGAENKELYQKININIQQAKKELKLYRVVVDVWYVIDKTGAIRDFIIDCINTDLDDATKEKLKTYVTSYFMNMPKHIPAKFMNENVDFAVKDRIYFW